MRTRLAPRLAAATLISLQLVKNIAARSSKRAPASFSLLAVFLLAGPVMFAACGDDGNVLGSDNGAGRSGGVGTSESGAAGAGQAGTQSSAGTNSGGTTNSAGSNSGGAHNAGTHSGGANSGGANSAGANTGGGTACNIGECLRANVCLDHCGGKVVYTGCCACAANTIEETACMGLGGAGSGGQANTDCGAATCTAAQSCVAYRTVGGAMFPVDTHGMCMTGRHPEGDLCEADFSYTCAELTGCSAPSTTCRCATGSACAGTTTCRLPTTSVWLEPAADLVCELQAP